MKKLGLIFLVMALLLCACQTQVPPDDQQSEMSNSQSENLPESSEQNTQQESTEPPISSTPVQNVVETDLLLELGFSFDFPESWEGHVATTREGQRITVSLDGEAVFRVVGTPNSPSVWETVELWQQEGYLYFGETPDHVVYYQVLGEIPKALETGYGSPYTTYTQTMNDIFHVVRMERETEDYRVFRDAWLFLNVIPKTNELRFNRLGVMLKLTDIWRDNAAISVREVGFSFRARALAEDPQFVETVPLSVLVLPKDKEQDYILDDWNVLGTTPAGTCYVHDNTANYSDEVLQVHPFMQSTAELLANGGVTLIGED